LINIDNRWVPCSLQGAVLAGDFESLNHLIAHQTDLNYPGFNLLQHALVSRELRRFYPTAQLNLSMVKFLLDKEVLIKRSDVYVAVETGSIEALQYLITKGADFDIATEALFWLAYLSTGFDIPFHEMFSFLISQGANINGTKDGSPLSMACEVGSLPLVQFLVSQDVDITLTDHDGMTALMLATYNGHIEIVQFLLESGANPNQRRPGNNGILLENALSFTCYSEESRLDNTILDFHTSDSNNPALVQLLLLHGAHPTLENLSYSPLHMAHARGLTEIATILERHIESSHPIE
jgi:hypothetical protein